MGNTQYFFCLYKLFADGFSTNTDMRKSNINSPNEDDYIYDTLRTANFTQEFSKMAMSAEGILQKMLTDVFLFFLFFIPLYNLFSYQKMLL